MPEQAPRRLVTFPRADEKSVGRACLDECESWVQTKLGGSAIGQGSWDRYQSDPDAWEGEPPPPPTPTAPIDTMRFHHGNIEPTLYHSPQGEWFRRHEGREYACVGISAERRYVGLTEEQAHEWLRFNVYDVPENTRPREQGPQSPRPPADAGSPDGKVPSIAELSELIQAFQALNAQNSHSVGLTWNQEDDFLPSFCRAADAVRPIRARLDSIDGWPPIVERAARALIRIFDAIVEDWGWVQVAMPEVERTPYLEERRAWFEENVARPKYEAALSWQARDGVHCPASVSAIANEGWDRGYRPIVPEDRVDAAWDEAIDRWTKAPRFGTRYPKIRANEATSLVAPFNQLHYVLESLPSRPAAPAPLPAAPEPTERDSPSIGESPGSSAAVPGRAIAPALAKPTEVPVSINGKSKDPEQPSPEMFRVYLAIQGGGRQKSIAETLNLSQATISRYKARVEAWKKAGGKLPGWDEVALNKSRPKTFSVDPRKMARLTDSDSR